MNYDDIYYQIRKIRLLIRKNYQKALVLPADVDYNQLPLLNYIDNNSGCNLSCIAKSLCTSKASVTKSVNRMVNSGLVEKREVDGKKIEYQLYLSEYGKKLVDEHKKAFENVEKTLFKDFSKQELEMISACLNRFAENLNLEEK